SFSFSPQSHRGTEKIIGRSLSISTAPDRTEFNHSQCRSLCLRASVVKSVFGPLILAGPLGFEPRQSAPKALDLPLVDGPVRTITKLSIANYRLSVYVDFQSATGNWQSSIPKFLPVLRARQSSRRLGWYARFAQPDHCLSRC